MGEAQLITSRALCLCLFLLVAPSPALKRLHREEAAQAPGQQAMLVQIKDLRVRTLKEGTPANLQMGKSLSVIDWAAFQIDAVK